MLGQAQDLAARLEHTIRQALPGQARIRAQQLPRTGRVRICPVDDDESVRPASLALGGDDVVLAHWTFAIFAELSDDGFLKFDQARISLTPEFEEAPIVRLEYESRTTGPPVSHWQFHGERGSLSFILALTHTSGRHRAVPMSLSALHFPTGGRRLRPGIEDFVQFLIQECGFDARPGWRRAVEDGRELARRFQFRAAVRDHQAEAAEVLKNNGWTVRPPDGRELTDNAERLREY